MFPLYNALFPLYVVTRPGEPSLLVCVGNEEGFAGLMRGNPTWEAYHVGRSAPATPPGVLGEFSEVSRLTLANCPKVTP